MPQQGVQIATVTPRIEDDPTAPRNPGVQTRPLDRQRPRYAPNERETTNIESLVAGYSAYVRRLALSILDESGEADDAVQETFLAAYRNLERYRGESSLKTWLTSIAVNVCRGKLRKRRMQQTLQNTLEALHILSPHVATPEQEAMQNEAGRRLWQAVDSLDEKHRLVVALRYIHELSVPEIAVALDVNEGTVHSRLHYARRKLHALLGDAHPYAEASDGPS
jgi:RNA polymerase sigma-70 factor (ECF subfamily)